MATINIYDDIAGVTRTLNLDISQSVVAGGGVGATGAMEYNIVISTSARTPENNVVRPVLIVSSDITDSLTTVIQDGIVEIFRRLLGTYETSSSSESSESSVSSSLGISSSSSTINESTSTS